QDHGEDDRRQPPRSEPAEESDRRWPGARPEHRQGDWNHPDDGQAQERVENHGAREVVERRYEHDSAEENERDRTEKAAGLLEEERHLASDVATQRSEDGAADEGGNEPAAAHPDGQSVGERGPCDRNDLKPDRIDELSRDSQPDHDRRSVPGGHAADDSVADLLEHKVPRGPRSDR